MLKIPAPRLLPITIAALGALLMVKCGRPRRSVAVDPRATARRRDGRRRERRKHRPDNETSQAGRAAPRRRHASRKAGRGPASTADAAGPPPVSDSERALLGPAAAPAGTGRARRSARRAGIDPGRGGAEARRARDELQACRRSSKAWTPPRSNGGGRLARPGEALRSHEAARMPRRSSTTCDAGAAAVDRSHEGRKGGAGDGGNEPRQGARRHRGPGTDANRPRYLRRTVAALRNNPAGG